MPKITDNPMTRSEITAKSDAKRGVMSKTYKLPNDIVAQIAQLSKDLNITQAEVIARALDKLKENSKKPTA